MPYLKSFSLALVYGLFNQPINRGLLNPPEFTYLIDNDGAQLTSSDGVDLIVNDISPPDIYLLDDDEDFLINNNGMYLIIN